MNTSGNARRRDKAFLYADQKDTKEMNKDAKRDNLNRIRAPINLQNVSKVAPDSNSTEKLLNTNQRLARRDSISNQSSNLDDDPPFYVEEP